MAAGLPIAITRGARTVPVLTALAEQTREPGRPPPARRGRASPDAAQVQALTLIMSVLMVGLLVFGRSEYLDAYDSANGQVVLAAIIGGYVALLARVATLSRFPRPGRFLTVGPDD